MAGEIINQWDLKRKLPLDKRQRVADQTARLAIQYLYKGLIVRQADTGQLYLYIGDETSNLTGDWELIQKLYTGTGAPSTTLGTIGDIHIHETTKVLSKKTGATTWTALFTITGAQIFTGTGAPSGGTGLDGDMYFRSNGDVYQKESGSWALKFNIKGSNGTNGDTYASTSTTSINLGTATAPLSLTIGTGKAYTVGQDVVVVSRADNANKVTGSVVSYNSGTGALVLNGLTITGTGTHTDWDVNLSGAPGATGSQGKAFIHIESDINLTQAKIVTIQGGSWTPQAPWSASVLNDTRSPSELTATAGIQGNKAGHSIAYDGTNWYDNGTWRGATGATGATGAAGADGATITNNYLPFVYMSTAVFNTQTRSIIVNRPPGGSLEIGGKCDVGTILIVNPPSVTSIAISTNANAAIIGSGDISTINPSTINGLSIGVNEKITRIVFICATRSGDNNTWEILSADRHNQYNTLTVNLPSPVDFRSKVVANTLIGTKQGIRYSNSFTWTKPATKFEESNIFYARIMYTFYVNRGTVTDTSAFEAHLEADTDSSGVWTEIPTSKIYFTATDDYQQYMLAHSDNSVPAGSTRAYRLVLTAQGGSDAATINVSAQAYGELLVIRK